MLALALVVAASPPTASGQEPMRLDLTGRIQQQTVVDREPGQYLGHVSTVLLEDDKTILAVYPKGHGKGAIVYKRSNDGGQTWSDRLAVPANWSTSREVPTIHRTVDPAGIERLILWSGLYPARLAHSEDNGASWSPLEPAGEWGGIVVMGDVAATATKGRYLAWFHDDGRFLHEGGQRSKTFRLLQVESTDGGLTWGVPRTIWSGSNVNHCEPGFVRRPDGREMALLLRENARRLPSHVMVSRDEGASWSDPRPMHPALTGDRHTLRYTADGRIVAVFRDTGLGDNPTKGDFVAWVGAYEDIVNGRGGQYHVRLLDNKNAWDCGYPGLEVLPDDTLVATTYGHWDEGEQPYIKSVRFTLLQLDGLAEAEKPTRPRKSPQEARRRAREDRLAMALNTLVSYRPTNQAPADPTIVDAQRMLRRAIPELVGRDGPVTRRLASLVAERRQQLIPTRQNKIRERDPLARILVRFDSERTRRQPTERVVAHAAAIAFPGPVPVGSLPTLRRLVLDLRTHGRHSLGLYAAPGHRVFVRFGDGRLAPPEGTRLRIGAHSDDIARRPAWPRMPRISRTFTVDSGEFSIASAYGGLIYVETDKTVPIKLEVTVANAFEAPWFVLGRTDPEDWRNTIRNAPGPWAELANDSVVLTVPSARIRELEDPTPILEFWNSALDTAADLATRPRKRNRPERYVADIEISAGSMHAGYPIMTHLGAVTDMVTLERLKKGPWGLFHELGHNHQSSDWTWKGTREVTVNLFSLCLCEKLCAVPWDKAWGGNLVRARQRLTAHIQAGTRPWHARRGKNGGRPDLALRLLMYSQIQREFGWEAFGHTFAQYRDLPSDQRPRTEQDKRDQWLIRLSRAVDRDFGPYFAAWGFEVTQPARAEVEDLLDWWPGDWQFRNR